MRGKKNSLAQEDRGSREGLFHLSIITLQFFFFLKTPPPKKIIKKNKHLLNSR